MDRDILEWCRILVDTAIVRSENGGMGEGMPPALQQLYSVGQQQQQGKKNKNKNTQSGSGGGVMTTVTSMFTSPGTGTVGIFAHPYFFPSEQNFKVLKQTIESAQSSLEICVFSITDNDLANAIIAVKKRGARVRIISDDQQAESRGSDVHRLGRDYGVPYVLDNNPSYMHNKFAVVDGKVVITGSYNWSKGARFDNRENILITNSPECLQMYHQEFEKLWSLYGGQG